MNRWLLHGCVAGAFAAGGWYFGSTEAVTATAAARRTVPPRASSPLASRAITGWAAELTAVRAVPGAASEPAWIKWAMSIPDPDVPAAIARLNTKTDFHALRYLYARWVKLDAAAAWASFRRSDIPGDVVHFYLPGNRAHDGGMGGSRLNNNIRELIASRMLYSWKSVDAGAAQAFAAKLADKSTPEAEEVSVRSYYLEEATGGEAGQPDTPPEQIAAAALARTAGEERTAAIASAARRWLKADAPAACAWLRSLPLDDRTELWRYGSLRNMNGAPLPDRVPALMSLLEARGLSPEFLTASQTSRHEDRYQYDSLYDTSAAVREWMATDASAAKQWLDAQPDSDLKGLLAGEAAAALVQTDVNAAIALLNETGGDQALAVRAFVNGWMESDARAALDWTGKIDDPPLRDTSRTAAALRLAGADPALAIETARTVADPALRSSVFKAVQQSLSWNPAALTAVRERFPGDEWDAGRK